MKINLTEKEINSIVLECVKRVCEVQANPVSMHYATRSEAADKIRRIVRSSGWMLASIRNGEEESQLSSNEMYQDSNVFDFIMCPGDKATFPKDSFISGAQILFGDKADVLDTGGENVIIRVKLPYNRDYNKSKEAIKNEPADPLINQ